MNKYHIDYRPEYFRPGSVTSVTIEADSFTIDERWMKFFKLALPVHMLAADAILSVKIEKIEDAS